MSYDIRPYQPGDEAEIVELLKLAFPIWAESDKALDEWRWRYLDCPLKSDIAVAEYDDHVVGVNHGLRLYIKFGNNSILSDLEGNTVVDPDHRGKGLYTKMLDLTNKMTDENNVNFILWSSSNPIIISDDSKRGHRIFPPPISYMVRIRDVDTHLKAKTSEYAAVKKYGFLLLKTINRIGNTVGPSEQINAGDVTIEDVPSFTGATDAFWSKAREYYNYAIERNRLYLNWRYGDPRGGEYVIKQATRGDRVLGYVVLELKNRGGYREGYIADILASPERSDVAYALMKEACDYFDRLNVNATYFWAAKNHPYIGLAERHGFIDSRYHMYIACRFRIDGGEFNLLKSSHPNKIHFQFGDIDRF
jgi:GNAT superfamily N-acetyltransferase